MCQFGKKCKTLVNLQLRSCRSTRMGSPLLELGKKIGISGVIGAKGLVADCQITYLISPFAVCLRMRLCSAVRSCHGVHLKSLTLARGRVAEFPVFVVHDYGSRVMRVARAPRLALLALTPYSVTQLNYPSQYQ